MIVAPFKMRHSTFEKQLSFFNFRNKNLMCESFIKDEDLLHVYEYLTVNSYGRFYKFPV